MPPPPDVLTLAVAPASSLPGGQATVEGGGCRHFEKVALEIGSRPVRTSVADASGQFVASVSLSGEGIGDHELDARCGALTATTNLVVADGEAARPGLSTLLVAIFILLVVVVLSPKWLFRKRAQTKQ